MFIVLDIQKDEYGEVETTATTYSEQNLAEGAYHQVLAGAALDEIPQHSCVLLTDEGFFMQSKCYKHEATEETTNTEETTEETTGE